MLGFRRRNWHSSIHGLGTSAGTLLSFAFLLTGCTPPPPSSYAPESFFDGGFGESEVRPNVWNVYYHGSGPIKFEAAEAYWLGRSAEITLSRGYTKFAVLQISEENGNHSDPLVVDGTIQFLITPAHGAPHRVLDAAAIQAALSAATSCKGNGPCTIDIDTIPGVDGLFLRVGLFNLSDEDVKVSVGDEVYALSRGRAVLLEHPRMLRVDTQNCTRSYALPDDTIDDVWRVVRRSNASVTIQIAKDFSLKVLRYRARPGEKMVPAYDDAESVVPKTSCR